MNTLKKIGVIAVVFWCFSLLVLTSPSYALTVGEVPNPRNQYGGWVTDMVDILSPTTVKKINQLIGQLEKKNGAEIAVVTVPETQPSPTPKAFATELFNTWHIGKKGYDNGVLFLISMGDRRVEIETGYGVQRILPDMEVSAILRQQVIPQFKVGNYEAGILAGLNVLVRKLSLEFSQSIFVVNAEELALSKN